MFSVDGKQPMTAELQTRHYRKVCATYAALYRFLRNLAYPERMNEHRIAQRHRVLKAGTIEFDGGAINCMVRNLSNTGAALDVASPVGIPERFTLFANGSHLPCHVVWRKEKRIGIAFD